LIINEDGRTVVVEDYTEKMTSRALPQFAVLTGDFTCCRMGHRLGNRAMPCDKGSVATVLRATYAHKLRHLRMTGDFVNYAWFLCVKPSILAGDTAEPFPCDESIAAFLDRYGWLGDDFEGKHLAAQPVFFPVFCAATEGNIAALRGLLAAGAEPARRLMGVGTSSLEAAALCGNADCCVALLDAGAELDGSSQFDGATPLIKAARGGNAAIVELFLARGADATHCEHGGGTALAAAVAGGYDDCVAMLTQIRQVAICGGGEGGGEGKQEGGEGEGAGEAATSCISNSDEITGGEPGVSVAGSGLTAVRVLSQEKKE
jgi:ankyrin repeat protein